MRDGKRLAVLGGEPLRKTPLHIVRPMFPGLDTFSQQFGDALATGAVTNNGPAVVEFERQLGEYLGVPVVVCNNGQSALMLMLRSAGIESGEVIVPSFTFSATAHAVRWCGATPVFADIGADGDLRINPEQVAALINERTVAVLGVDVYGIACDYEALDALGRNNSIKVLYDSAPAFGTKVDGRPVAGHGDAQIFSFHATKAMTTMEGGCIASRDEDLLARARELRNFGQGSGADCDEPGMNAKMMEVSALIGIEQLKGFDHVVEHRASIAERYRRGLSSISGLSFARVPKSQVPIWLYYPIIVDPDTYGLDRSALALALESEQIFVRKYFEMGVHRMTAYQDLKTTPLPETERVASQVLALPVYNDMTGQECDDVIAAIRDIGARAAEVSDAIRRRRDH
jgi:dTDP-4-amino-4,6-dideoxygalactose transaminase